MSTALLLCQLLTCCLILASIRYQKRQALDLRRLRAEREALLAQLDGIINEALLILKRDRT